MKKILLSGVFLLMSITFGIATPPSELKVTYDSKKQSIQISAAHPSNRLRHHFLRRVVIFKDGVEDKTVYYTKQELASGLEADIEYKTQGGEHLKLVIYCSQGGVKEAELNVPKQEGQYIDAQP